MDKHQFEPAYLVTLDELYHPGWAAQKKYRVDLLRKAIADFWPEGHPTRFVLLTGTNGKGSTAYHLCRGLRCFGNTGSWTGPHIFDYAERFHLNGDQVDHASISRVYLERLEPYQRQLMQCQGDALTFAELGILLALHLFAENEVVWAVLEVGAGGRYAPITAVDPAACVLTNVGDDHPITLGHELWQRALEKAGIARSGIPFFTAAEGDALFYVERTAMSQGAPVTVVDDAAVSEVRLCLSEPQPNYRLRNLALAASVVEHFAPNESFPQMIDRMNGSPTGRFHHWSDRVLIDTAHNANKVAALADHLQARYKDRSIHFLLGLSRSRDAVSVFAPLAKLAEKITITDASYAGQPPAEVAGKLADSGLFKQVAWENDAHRAFEASFSDLPPNGLLVLTGSAYMIDQVLNPNPFLKTTNRDFGRRGKSFA